MLLASNIGFLALVAPAQIFAALSFDPERRNHSFEEYKSFIIQGNIYQCLINTYYAASFVFCFASSSMFRREIKKLIQKSFQIKASSNNEDNHVGSRLNENKPFLQQNRLATMKSTSFSRTNDHISQQFNLEKELKTNESIYQLSEQE